MERFPLQDREPNLDLVKPGCSRRREVETHVPMSFEPLIILGLVSVEIVEGDMDGRGWVSRDASNSPRPPARRSVRAKHHAVPSSAPAPELQAPHDPPA